MRILLSNDDGIHAEGIKQLETTLRGPWFREKSIEVFVAAPDRNRSGASHSLTLHAPLRVKWLHEHRVSIEGTPTDCVHLAVTGLLKQPDMVLSGINDGGNLGDDVLYSGTVAAAVEGRFLGFPSIAISLVTGDDASSAQFDTAAAVADVLVRNTLKKALPEDIVLNVNVPNVALKDLCGYKITRLGARHKAEPVIEGRDPRGRRVYWVGLPGEEQDAGEGTDFHAIRCNQVSITPLKIDFTHYAVFDQVKHWLSGLES